MKLGLALFLTLTSLFISGQCRSQCAIFTPGMAITQVNPGSPPFGEDVTKAIDGNIYTKYLNFNKTNTGFIVNTGKNVVAVRMDLTTANDEPSRDPINYQIQGSNNGTTWTNITSGNISCNSNRFLTRSFTFSNNVSYSWYRIIFPSLCNVSLANSMQVAEVQLYANSVAASVSILGNPSTTRKGISTFTAVPDSIKFQFTKNKEDIVYLYTFNEQSGLSTPLLTTMNMEVSIPHTARYYLIVSGNYSKFIGPFELVADERKRTLSTKQLLGQYTN
jgi:hypothetical protein